MRNIACARGKSRGRSLRDSSRSHLQSQYRHSHLPNNELIAAVEYAAVTAVAANVYPNVPLEITASVEEIIAEMLTHNHCNSHNHCH